MIIRRRGAVYRRFAERSRILVLVVVRICDDDLTFMALLWNGSETEVVEWGQCSGLPVCT